MPPDYQANEIQRLQNKIDNLIGVINARAIQDATRETNWENWRVNTNGRFDAIELRIGRVETTVSAMQMNAQSFVPTKRLWWIFALSLLAFFVLSGWMLWLSTHLQIGPSWIP